MKSKVYYIILEDSILLSKSEYHHWREIQSEYYDNFKACLGPWTYEELISYLEDDFTDESRWPFIKENLIGFFEDSEIIHYSDRLNITKL
jgi:hypothetical protein